MLCIRLQVVWKSEEIQQGFSLGISIGSSRHSPPPGLGIVHRSCELKIAWNSGPPCSLQGFRDPGYALICHLIPKPSHAWQLETSLSPIKFQRASFSAPKSHKVCT